MPAIVPLPSDYGPWLAELKARIHAAQQQAARSVNSELVLLYWQIGRGILERQGREGWGSKVIERLSQDLRNAFPTMKGFSRANLLYMRAFAEAWPDQAIVQQAVGQLPWGAQSGVAQQAESDRSSSGIYPACHRSRLVASCPCAPHRAAFA